jgi:deazaflavin-dependent oxidoreductase (nitroreductase family)
VDFEKKEASMYSRLVNAFSATRAGSWLVKHVASKLDPMLFEATNGRFTSTGVPTLPMLALTVTGRRTGEPRRVQLAYVEDGGDYLVVASAMGQERHPGWRYNLEANPNVHVQLRGEHFAAAATALGDEEKARVWPEIRHAIPQMNVYERRTNRNIRVFRLRRQAASSTRTGIAPGPVRADPPT